MSRGRIKNKKIILITIIAIFVVTGTVLGINGFFGGGASVPSDTMTRGLVGFWNFEEGRGTTTADISGNNNTGVFQTVAASPAWVKGKVGGGLSFDGTDDYISALNVGNVQSVEFWVNDANATDGILELINNATYISIAASAITATGFTSPTIYVNGVATSTLATGWNHIVITTNTAVAAASFLIGEANTDYMAGILDEVRIYNRALSAAEVRYHYNRGGPVALWKFDEGASSTAYDASGNGNTGTLTNMNVTTATSSWVSGKYGSALSFDGVDDFIDVSNTTTTARTISFWLNRQDSANRDVIDLGTPEIKISSNAITSTGLTSPTYYVDGIPGTALKTNTWQHISITDTADTTISPNLIDIGKASASYFNGLIDDVRIYNYARTPDEIRLDYNAGFAALFGPQTDCDRDPGSCMTKGLVGQWSMDEGTGQTSYDISGNANNGQLGSTTAADVGDPAWTKGKVGSALSFDGVDDNVSAADVALLDITNNITIEMWLKANVVENDKYPLHKINAYGLSIGASGVGGASGKFGSHFQTTDGVWHVVDSTTSPTTGNWYHLVGTYDGTNQKIYVNGVLEKTKAQTGSIKATTNNLFIGSTGGVFNGLIDETRLYNRVLSAEEVRYHYNRGGPIGYWKFDEGNGTTTYDASGNGNTGTLLGGMGTSTAEASGWKSGKHGSALSFDGVDDFIDVSNTTTTARTISFWLNRQDSANRDVIDLGTPEIKISSNAITSTGLTSPTYYVDGIPGTALKTNTWQHISITDTADTTISPNLIDIGKASANYFSGLLDDVRIYNYARTPDEIRLDYNAGFAALFGPQTDCDRDPGSCMTKGLVGQWSMDEGRGTTTADISGNNNTGVFATVAASPAWTKGKVSGGLSFDGTTTYVGAGTNSSILPDTFTVELWEKWSGVATNYFIGWHTIQGQPALGMDAGKPLFYMGALNFRYFAAAAGTTMSNGNWHHIVWTIPGSAQTDINNAKLYIDGVDQSVDSTDSSGAQRAKDILYIGKRSTQNAFNGTIDEVRIYNRVLSASEVRYHYNRGAPVALWKFDEGNGTTTYDASGNGNTGTLLGGMGTSTAEASGWKSGKHGSALSFDGVDDFIDVSNTTTTARTISFWLNRQDSANRDVIDLGTPEIKISSNAITSTGLTSPTYYVDGIPGTALKTNTWQHISITDTADTTISPNLIDIGKASASYFNGLIDDVRIYNYARTPEQVLQDYNGGKSIYFK